MSERHEPGKIGLSFQEIAAHRLLSREEEYALGERIQAGGPDADEARRELIRMNVRLAVECAGRFANRGVEFEDLVSEACIGLDTAARKFDPSRGNRFSTVAYMWMFQRLQRAVAQQQGTIRLPDQLHKARLTHHNQPDLTVEQLATRHKTTVTRVRAALAAAHVTASLDAPVNGNDGPNGYDQIADADADDPADVRDDSETAWVRDALAELPADEREVVTRAFGFDGQGERTLHEVAAELDLDLSAVKKLHAAGLKRVRALAPA